jgi:hypothetical protein
MVEAVNQYIMPALSARLTFADKIQCGGNSYDGFSEVEDSLST